MANGARLSWRVSLTWAMGTPLKRGGTCVSTDKGWRVDDIVYGGAWDFGNKGRLSDTLKAVVAESKAAPK